MLSVLTACTGVGTSEPHASPPSAPPSSTPGRTTTQFAYSTEPVAIEPGTYRIPKSAWSVADFEVTLPEGWTVQYGHVFQKHADAPDEFGFYAVVVEEVYADACDGSNGRLIEVGPSIDDLTTALLEQAGPETIGPVTTTLGGYPATRIEFSVPEGFDLAPCILGDIGLQIWYSRPADKYFVLLSDAIMTVYLIDVDGQRQVFLAGYRSATSEEDVAELQTVLDSIHIE
jgi:hypothetical protein